MAPRRDSPDALPAVQVAIERDLFSGLLNVFGAHKTSGDQAVMHLLWLAAGMIKADAKAAHGGFHAAREIFRINAERAWKECPDNLLSPPGAVPNATETTPK